MFKSVKIAGHAETKNWSVQAWADEYLDKTKPHMVVTHLKGKKEKKHWHVVGIPNDDADHLQLDKQMHLREAGELHPLRATGLKPFTNSRYTTRILQVDPPFLRRFGTGVSEFCEISICRRARARSGYVSSNPLGLALARARLRRPSARRAATPFSLSWPYLPQPARKWLAGSHTFRACRHP